MRFFRYTTHAAFFIGATKKKVRFMMKTQKILCAVAAILLILSLSACGSGSSGSSGTAGTAEPEKTVDISKFTYVNEDIGLGIIYPDDFTTLSEEEIRAMMAEVIENAEFIYNDPEEVEEMLKQIVPTSMTMKHPFDYIDGHNSGITMLVYRGSVDDIVDFADNVNNNAGDVVAYEAAFGEATATQLGGKDAAVLYAKSDFADTEVLQAQYYVANNGYLAMIALTAGNEEELNELEEIMDTIEFIK
jgi:hypothetical protein